MQVTGQPVQFNFHYHQLYLFIEARINCLKRMWPVWFVILKDTLFTQNSFNCPIKSIPSFTHFLPCNLCPITSRFEDKQTFYSGNSSIKLLSVMESCLYCLALCMLGNFAGFLVASWFFSKMTFPKNYFRNTIRVSNSLGPEVISRCHQ